MQKIETIYVHAVGSKASSDKSVHTVHQFAQMFMDALPTLRLKYQFAMMVVMFSKIKNDSLGYVLGRLIGDNDDVWKDYGESPSITDAGERMDDK